MTDQKQSLRGQGSRVGYVVALYEHGAWNLTWDGELHSTQREAVQSAASAEESGWQVKVAAVDLCGGAPAWCFEEKDRSDG